MNKFVIQEIPKYDATKPVLFKIYLGNMYYLHKGKDLVESAEHFLDDVFRGMRNKKYPEAYKRVVEHCNTNRSLYKVSLEVVLNADPAKILKKEEEFYKRPRKDPASLNILSIPPYKPEWMVKQGLQKRCSECLKTGLVAGKTVKFKFCPNCGRLNK